MPIVRREDHPVLIRGPGLPTLQYLVDRASGSNAVTVCPFRSPLRRVEERAGPSRLEPMDLAPLRDRERRLAGPPGVPHA